jgi:16S rRNA (guanine(966)-N(2))-methyltransferase RsmD
MRVIAGTAKGTRLNVPKGRHVRPTRGKARESLFSVLAPRLPGTRFLDLFAGSGANGIEALSRGAAVAVFADNDARAISAIRRNLEATHLLDRAEVVKLDLPRDLERLAGGNRVYEIVFADPPYLFRQFEDLFHTLRRINILAPGGLIVVEHSVRLCLSEVLEGYQRTRESVFGETGLSFFIDGAEKIC